MHIHPLRDNIVVRPQKAETQTASGIVIPDTAGHEKPQQGEVVAVGSGKVVDGKATPMEVAVGDTILFTKYAPTEVKIDGEDLFILSESDVLGIIQK